MAQFLEPIIQFLFSQFRNIWTCYTTVTVISWFFALLVLDRIFHIFDILKR